MPRLLAPAPGMEVEILHPNDPSKTVISVREPWVGDKYMETIKLKATGKNSIMLEVFEARTALGKPVALPLKFSYHPETGYATIREVMEDRNDRIKEFYYAVWFGNEKCPFTKPEFDDNILATGSYDATIRIWNIETGEVITTLNHYWLAFSYTFLILSIQLNFRCNRRLLIIYG